MVEFADLDTPANRSYVRRIAYAFGLTYADAEDVTQEVLIKAWLKCHTIRSDPRAWLNRVTVNACRDRLSEPHPLFVPLADLADLPDTSPSPLDALLCEERYRNLRTAVSQLRPDHHQAVTLLYWQSVTVAEIALLLDISRGTVKSRLSRARDELRRRLAGTV